MSVIRECEGCGMPYEYEFGSVVYCKYCGARHFINFNEDVIEMIKHANKLRASGSFQESISIYNDLIVKFPKSSELHLGKFLAEYGVKDYERIEEEEAFLSTNGTSVFENESFNNVMLFELHRKNEYQNLGEVIEAKRQRNVEILSKINQNAYTTVILCSQVDNEKAFAKQIYNDLHTNFDLFYPEETAKNLKTEIKQIATLLAVEKAKLLYVVVDKFSNIDKFVETAVQHFLKTHKSGYLTFITDDIGQTEMSKKTDKRMAFSEQSIGKMLDEVIALSCATFDEYEECCKTKCKLNDIQNPSPILDL